MAKVSEKKGIQVNLNRLSMSMDANEFYNSEGMRSKFQALREFKKAVIDKRKTEPSVK
ncbi:hypothetical protein ABWH96_11375 [Marivirga tractuosa]|uniref:hypothetical protein n=1 Tax=Marivirga tractuosa TaxID=1006 RepID=UPI0035CEF76A